MILPTTIRVWSCLAPLVWVVQFHLKMHTDSRCSAHWKASSLAHRFPHFKKRCETAQTLADTSTATRVLTPHMPCLGYTSQWCCCLIWHLSVPCLRTPCKSKRNVGLGAVQVVVAAASGYPRRCPGVARASVRTWLCPPLFKPLVTVCGACSCVHEARFVWLCAVPSVLRRDS